MQWKMCVPLGPQHKMCCISCCTRTFKLLKWRGSDRRRRLNARIRRNTPRVLVFAVWYFGFGFECRLRFRTPVAFPRDLWHHRRINIGWESTKVVLVAWQHGKHEYECEKHRTRGDREGEALTNGNGGGDGVEMAAARWQHRAKRATRCWPQAAGSWYRTP